MARARAALGRRASLPGGTARGGLGVRAARRLGVGERRDTLARIVLPVVHLVRVPARAASGVAGGLAGVVTRSRRRSRSHASAVHPLLRLFPESRASGRRGVDHARRTWSQPVVLVRAGRDRDREPARRRAEPVGGRAAGAPPACWFAIRPADRGGAVRGLVRERGLAATRDVACAWRSIGTALGGSGRSPRSPRCAISCPR